MSDDLSIQAILAKLRNYAESTNDAALLKIVQELENAFSDINSIRVGDITHANHLVIGNNARLFVKQTTSLPDEVINLIMVLAETLSPRTKEEWRLDYLESLIEQIRFIPLSGIDRKNLGDSAQADLTKLYTALEVKALDAEGRQPKNSNDRSSHRSAVSVLNTHKYLALLGDPGSGKSTFLNYVALCMAAPFLNPSTNADLYSLRKTFQPWDHPPLLPVRVILRDFVQAVVSKKCSSLLEFAASEVPKAYRKNLEPLLKEWLAESGLLLLDGLDEVFEAERYREIIKTRVGDFIEKFPNVRVLLTSRTYAYQKQNWKLPGFTEAVLAPFTSTKIDEFIRCWYEQMRSVYRLKPAECSERIRELQDVIKHSPALRELATRPLLLTLIASLHTTSNGALPEKREKLYHEAVELLLNQWNRRRIHRAPDGSEQVIQPGLIEWMKADREAVRSLLDRLAFKTQNSRSLLDEAANIDEGELLEELDKLNLNPDVSHEKIISYLSEHTGLLEPRGNKVYAFPHHTFQEYLAACHLTNSQDFPANLATLLRSNLDRWREVTLLAGAKAARGAAITTWYLADALCGKGIPGGGDGAAGLANDSASWCALIAAQVLIENHRLDEIPGHQAGLMDQLRKWLITILVHGLLSPLDRAQAGSALAVLGDPRDLEELIEIPAGEFLMGTDKEAAGDNRQEVPRHRVFVDTYKIGKFPITQKLWKNYIDAIHYKGYDPASICEHTNHKEGLCPSANHPLVRVSWNETLGFCKWLEGKWQSDGKISSEEIVRLPTEAEWEKAARGGDGRQWPWGNAKLPDAANINDSDLGSNLGHVCSVGMFPNGKSPYGCLDMAGNVWEWTFSKVMPYPYNGMDGRENPTPSDEPRVARGGSYESELSLARCAFRNERLSPNRRSHHLGFRIAVVHGRE